MDSILPPPAGPSRRASSFHAWLREATRPDHELVDAAFGGFDLANRAGYRAFLCAHVRALLPVEAWLGEGRVRSRAAAPHCGQTWRPWVS